MQTTGLMPDFLMVRTWCTAFSTPSSSHFKVSFVAEKYSLGTGLPGGHGRAPALTPWCFRPRMVAVSTDTLGMRPLKRHLTFQNFSKPMSAPKPDSVIW